MATPLKPIECSAQPLSIAFHPVKDILAAGLVDGTVEIHDLIAKGGPDDAAKAKTNRTEDDDDDDDMDSDNDEDDQGDTILSSIHVAKAAPQSKSNTQMLAKLDESGSNATTSNARVMGKATQAPSCRSVLFSRSPHESKSNENNNNNNNNNLQSGGEHIFTACNGGSLRCLDTELACSLEQFRNPDAASSSSPILWSIETAHNSGINKLYQLPHSSPCGAALVTGDDVGTVRLWDTRICGNNNNNNPNGTNHNPFDNLMKLPTGCIQHWKVNHDYITDFETNVDGTTLFASSGDGALSVFDVRYANRKGTTRSVILPDIDPRNPEPPPPPPQSKNQKPTWETMGYSQSDNQEDELLSLTLLKNSSKLLCGTQQGILSLFSYGQWGDISDRFPGHPQSIDALLKIDEDTVLTGSSDGLVRAVQLLPNSLLGVLGGHDGFPVEGLGWSAGRKLVGSLSHDEYVRLWDGSFLNEDDDDEEEGMGGGEMRQDVDDDAAHSKRGLGGVSTKGKANGDDSGDDWEDMDEDDDEDMDDDDDSDSDDSGDGGGGGKPKKRENIFKTENESFFSDL